ncbi:alpha/beta hydrolase [Streptococcus hillyeri]|uniref:Esterase family protein n=1 Tax=Streptococcus hillyeri TaxID=2282420 RepID=A0A3L9DPX7_9STRE|nr:alpha/beta hydrolase family protein [Streptococcus hillyeri]RLY01142.1 esterase family protein [Streptococcus hillyeri]
MAFMKIEYSSEVLKQDRQVTVIYPECGVGEDIPVLYLLHGMNGNENSWNNHSNVQRLVKKTNLIVVMPNCDNGWYTNTASGMAYYDAIAIELPQVLRRFFPNMTTKRDKTFIAGLSMGGYGALKIALTTNQFSWAGSFSGALFTDETILEHTTENETPYWTGIFGPLTAKNLSRHSLTYHAKVFDGQTNLYAWCGQEDFLFEANEKAVADLKKMGITIDYRKSHGTHEWYYWEKQIEIFLEMLPIDYVKEERLS